MAEIDVVPKSRSNIWLWIIVALIVVAILWVVMSRMSGTSANRVGELLDPMRSAIEALAA
jgi:bacteriorhodopsin